VNIYDLIDQGELNRDIDSKYINVRPHPTLPIKIYNYSKLATIEYYWSDPVKICRGLITDNNGNIVSRPYPKFFNVEEGSLHERLQLADYLEIKRKEDGWFGIHWKYDGQHGVASRGSFDSLGAKFATDRFQRFVKYGSINEISDDISLIFEIISKPLRIVKQYDWEGICLTGAINKNTGLELRKDELTSVWETLNQYSKGKPWCRLVDFFDDKDIDDCLNDDDKKEEGYVVTGFFDNGSLPIKGKIKLSEYKRLHRLITNVTPRKIHNKFTYPLDEFLQNPVPVEYREWVRDTAKTFSSDFFRLYDKVKEAHNYYLESKRAISIVFSNQNDVRNHALRATQARYGSVAELVILLDNKDFFRLYHEIWKTNSPSKTGCDDVFYEEGSNE
jgi:RNA ligase